MLENISIVYFRSSFLDHWMKRDLSHECICILPSLYWTRMFVLSALVEAIAQGCANVFIVYCINMQLKHAFWLQLVTLINKHCDSVANNNIIYCFTMGPPNSNYL